MSQIDDFNEQSNFSVDDFISETATQAPVTSLGSNQNLAAHAALLAPAGVNQAEAYQQSKDELDNTGQSNTADSLIANAKGENLMGYRRAAAELLINPEATEEYKRAALSAINDPTNGLFSARAMVATQTAEKPVKNESLESADLRGVWAAGVTSVLNYQREKQKLYNEMQLRADANKAAPYVSFAEDFVPLAYGFKQSSIVDSIRGAMGQGGGLSKAWGTLLPGTATAVLRDNFNSIPYEERGRVMQEAMNIIARDGSTILLPEEYDNANMQVFRQLVESGSYDATDETIDNILGVLDVIGLGGFLAKTVRGGEAATRLAGESGEASRATQGNPRRPSPQSDWRTGNAREPGVYDQAGNPSYAMREWEMMTPEQRSWARRYNLTNVQPTAPALTVKDANPELGRNFHEAIENDTTGDIAAALYGTSREDAIAHNISPQVGALDGAVESKVFHPERNSDFEFMPNADVLDFVDNASGYSHLAESEKRILRSQVINDFTNATGMVNRKEMTSVEALDDGVRFSAVYGPTDSGWSNVKEAKQQALYALRDYGVTPDDINVLVRTGDDYRPVSLNDVKVDDLQGDYLLQIKHDYKFNTADLERDGFEAFDVRWNGFDRWLPGGGKIGQGTLQSNLLDPQSMLHPDFTKGATISGLRGAQLEQKLMETVTPYVKTMRGMKAERQQMVYAKIREANAKGQEFNYSNLRAEGFDEKQISALRQWKESQDTLFELSNRDMVKTYRTRGYGLMEHSESGTRLLVKPLPRNQAADGIKAFDPVTNEVRTLTRDEITELYGRNGNIAKTANPLTIDGMHVEHVINNNAANSTYIRSLNNTDRILNYRKGYYAVRYTNPHFIERKVVDELGNPILDAGGREQWRAVATAANIPDAQRAVERLTATKGGEYRYRGDLKGEDFEVAESQRLQAGGMSAQRIRGERLEEALGQSELSEATNIQSPMESLLHSVSSISARVSTRDWLETAKARFVAQYADVLPKRQGMPQYPKTRAEIGEAGQKTSKMAADARTTWEYIRQMENGYINSIDDAYKASLNALADFIGTKGFGRTEETLRSVGQRGPTKVLKSLAFNLMLAMNPLRQFLIQSHQALMLMATFPRYTTMHMVDDLMLMFIHKMGGTPAPMLLKAAGRTAEEAKAMFDALERSGIGAGISKHDMVRESLGSIADEAATHRLRMSKFNQATRPARAALGAMRKVGFDFGEYISSSASFLAHYDEAVRAGRKIGNAEIENITAKSRNYVYNMDQAGAMPYNYNSLALITQFLQVPHKAILQFTFNRGLTVREKSAITAFTTMMFGPNAIVGLVPAAGNALENYLSEILPDDPAWREGIINGLESLFLNRLLTKQYGEDVSIDYSSLAPLDAYGLTEFIQNVLNEGPAQVVASSPAGSLLFGTNPRLMTVAKTVTRMAGLGGSEYENDPVKWSNLMMDVANLSSGFSNAYKASIALEYGRKYSALGGVTDSNVNSVEAFAQALGLPTQDETNTRKILDKTYKNKEQFESDVKKVFQTFARQINQDGITPDQFEYYVEMNRAAMSAFKGNPAATQVWQGELRKLTASKDFRVVNTILEQCGFAKPEDVRRLIQKAPNLTQEQRDNLLAVCDYNLEYRPDLKDKK